MVSIGIVALAVKIVGFGTTGVGVASLLRLFHNYEWKPTTKKGVTFDEGESLRERSKRIS